MLFVPAPPNGLYRFQLFIRSISESWRPAPISAYGEKVAPEEIQRSKNIISKGLKKYPCNNPAKPLGHLFSQANEIL
ncbi:MAG: hypothetical protein WDO16_22965 [Bacteroidota bacterium]